MKKVNHCGNGGYVSIQRTMMSMVVSPEGRTATFTPCKACEEMMEVFGFDRDAMEQFVEAYATDISREKNPNSDTQPEDNQQPSNTNKKIKKGKAAKATEEGEDAPDAEEEEEEEADPFAFARALYPVIQLLEPGEFGKAFPYRCTICKTKTWPEGKVGDCVEAKASSVKFFVAQHINCISHQNKLKLIQEREEAKLVPCEGLCIGDVATAGTLHSWQAEFKVWASMANFGHYGRHKYWHVASEDSWMQVGIIL